MTGRKTLPRDLRTVRKASEGAGWVWDDRTNHTIIRDPAGAFVCSVSNTLYSGALIRKIKSRLRNAGCPGC